MAILTIVEAARLTGVSRSQLYRYIRSGKLSRTPDGQLDTAELLRAGLLLHVPSPVPSMPSSVPLSVPETHDVTPPTVSSVPAPVPPVPSTDTATLERLIEVLHRELNTARERETLLTQRLHERETQLTQMAHERETQLLHLVAQMHQQNQRLLDLPRPPPPPSPQAPRSPPAVRPTPARRPSASGDPRGAMRRRIGALLQDHPAGLTPTEMQTLLGVDRSLADTVLGMLRYGLVQRVGRGRYI